MAGQKTLRLTRDFAEGGRMLAPDPATPCEEKRAYDHALSDNELIRRLTGIAERITHLVTPGLISLTPRDSRLLSPCSARFQPIAQGFGCPRQQTGFGKAGFSEQAFLLRRVVNFLHFILHHLFIMPLIKVIIHGNYPFD
jgi:hypothetical protein